MEMGRFVLVFLFFSTATACLHMVKSATHEDECGIQSNATKHRNLPVGRPVYGVQPVGDELYVIRDSTPYIEVYHRSTFQPKRNISVPGMQGPYDMVQSGQGQTSLFIADWFNTNSLFRVQVPQGTVSSWSTQENAFTVLGLARSNAYTDGNILVTSSASQKVRKFDVSGNKFGEITVPDIPSPRQGIQVSPKGYAVCHGYGEGLHRVCLVNGSGAIDKCYGNTSGSGIDQLNTPGRLELFQNECILVADTGNQRVVALNKNLKYVRNLISSDIDSPYRLYFDDTKSLLFVADNKVNATGYAVSGKVSVFRL